mmetsp:Transcript_4865/g.17513  ORF Transcript_4865/g.17513 Transcript_4865/m.17513 type:complete len:216 (-) Transcript_4865:470-1117(-)
MIFILSLFPTGLEDSRDHRPPPLWVIFKLIEVPALRHRRGQPKVHEDHRHEQKGADAPAVREGDQRHVEHDLRGVMRARAVGEPESLRNFVLFPAGLALASAARAPQRRQRGVALVLGEVTEEEDGEKADLLGGVRIDEEPSHPLESVSQVARAGPARQEVQARVPHDLRRDEVGGKEDVVEEPEGIAHELHPAALAVGVNKVILEQAPGDVELQ